jgi:hypothetical protein
MHTLSQESNALQREVPFQDRLSHRSAVTLPKAALKKGMSNVAATLPFLLRHMLPRKSTRPFRRFLGVRRYGSVWLRGFAPMHTALVILHLAQCFVKPPWRLSSTVFHRLRLCQVHGSISRDAVALALAGHCTFPTSFSGLGVLPTF